MQVIISVASVTGGLCPDRAAKQQTPVMQVIISVASVTGGIYPDRAAKQQTPGCRLLFRPVGIFDNADAGNDADSAFLFLRP